MIVEDSDQIALLEKSVADFVCLGSESGVNRVALTEQTPNPVGYWGYAALIPGFPIPSETGLYLFSTVPRVNVIPYIPLIHAMEIPSDVKELGIKSNRGFEIPLAERSRRLGLPTILIGFGKVLQEERPYQSLWFISGLTPEQALRRIKARL